MFALSARLLRGVSSEDVARLIQPLGVCGGSCETAAPLLALHLPLVRLRPQAVCCWVRTDGGYMTMWIATQTKRFKAAVSHAGLSNHISFCERPPPL